MDYRTTFFMQLAVQLIASGGAYAHRKVGDVVTELMAEAGCCDDFFASEDDRCPGCESNEPDSVH
jgi:hypothetical protein